MKLQTLFLGLLLASYSISENCDLSCAAVTNIQPVCAVAPVRNSAAVPQIYLTACHASCSNDSNIIVKECKDVPVGTCLSDCITEYNLSVCKQKAKDDARKAKTYNPDQLLCTNLGTLTNDIKVAQCSNPNAAVAFDCKDLNLETQLSCSSKCTALYSCKDSCKSDVKNPICAVDSIIYQNNCEFACMRTSAADGAGANEVASSAACLEYVKLRYTIVVGAPAKIKRTIPSLPA